MNLKLFVCYHKNYIRPFKEDCSIYIPLYSNKECFPGTGFLTTTRNEISKYNPFLSEGTSLYWLINNFEYIENIYEKIDYIGLEHYRRWFLNFKDNISDNNVLAPKVQFKNLTVEKQFINEHKDCSHLKKCIDKLISLGYFSSSDKENFLQENYLFRCNMFIMPRKIFFEYGKYFTECVNILIQMIDNNDFSKDLNIRNPGFTLERLTGIYLYKLFIEKKYNVIPSKIFN